VEVLQLPRLSAAIVPISRSAFEGAEFAGAEFGQPSAETALDRGWPGQRLPAAVGQAKGETAAIARIGLTLDLALPNQSIDGPANCRSTALYRNRDLAERCRFGLGDGGKQVALLPHCPGRGGVAAKLLDEPREASAKRRR
jgi:hypothetical protein